MKMKMERSNFETTKCGETVTKYTLYTEKMIVSILDYGATIQSLLVKDRTGTWVDVVLGYDTVLEYEENDGYLGACIGRVGNRIGGGSFALHGKTYRLYQNDGKNHLHGGLRGFDRMIWQAEALEDGIRFFRLSPDGEEGYPGNLTVSVSYQVKEGTLRLTYDGASDADTLCNLTNHSYFNLDGGGSVLSHKLQVHAEAFLENDAGCLPTGKILPVEGTPFDFRKEKEIGRDLTQKDAQLENYGGYDHNFCLDGAKELRTAAHLHGQKTGISMEVATTMVGMQVYSGNFLTHRLGKHGNSYDKHGAICLETQFYPNAMHCDGFEKPVLRAGETYHHITTFSFSAGDGK